MIEDREENKTSITLTSKRSPEIHLKVFLGDDFSGHLQRLHSRTACRGQYFCSLTHMQCWALLLKTAFAALLPWCLLPRTARGLIPCPSVLGPFASCWCHHILPSPCCCGALPLPRHHPRYSGVQAVPPAASAAIFHHYVSIKYGLEKQSEHLRNNSCTLVSGKECGIS